MRVDKVELVEKLVRAKPLSQPAGAPPYFPMITLSVEEIDCLLRALVS